MEIIFYCLFSNQHVLRNSRIWVSGGKQGRSQTGCNRGNAILTTNFRKHKNHFIPKQYEINKKIKASSKKLEWKMFVNVKNKKVSRLHSPK